MRLQWSGRMSAAVALVGLVAAADARASCPALVGDVNGSGLVDVADAQCSLLGALWAMKGMDEGEPLPACIAGIPWLDVDCNGAPTVVDVLIVISRVLGQPLSPAIDTDQDTCPDSCVLLAELNPYTPSVARIWNEALLNAIRVDTPRPTVHARNLFHLSATMYDAWVAWDEVSLPWFYSEEAPPTADVQAAREEAISYAAYRLLIHRFATSAGAATSMPVFHDTMVSLGYDPEYADTTGDSPASFGCRVAEAMIQLGLGDGANEINDYKDTSGYAPINPPLVLKYAGTTMNNPNHWQQLALDVHVTQNGIILEKSPEFLGPHWGEIISFGLYKPSPNQIHIDPGPPPKLGTTSAASYMEGNLDVIRKSSYLDPDDGVLIDISPNGRGNNTLGYNDGEGHAINPWTGEPYAPQIVKRGDWSRVIAEFWADGPDSETPPGHWNTVANELSDSEGLVRRLGGFGPIVDPLEWDIRMYLALNGALHDAAIAAWDCKEHYDYVRPVSSIRYMAQNGQSSDPSKGSYHPWGLPLVPGLVEIITPQTTAPGQKHEHMAGGEGYIAIYAWRGTPENPETEYSGAGWTYGVNWTPYQRPTFVTPPFPGYVSGHSTFSRAAAEVLTLYSGSKYWPQGMGGFSIPQDDHLVFEIGPTEAMELEWATFYDAADESGISRIYGGIHVPVDDGPGRIMGSIIGKQAFAHAMSYFLGDSE